MIRTRCLMPVLSRIWLGGLVGLAGAFVPSAPFVSRRPHFRKVTVTPSKLAARGHHIPSASTRWVFPPLRMADDDEVEFIEADDGEALQALFAKECDGDGLMIKSTLEAIPAIAELLKDGDLLQAELDEIWLSAPKFPDLEGTDDVERIDVDSFIQVYRDIDDIFEDDDEDVPSSASGKDSEVVETATKAADAVVKEVATDQSAGGTEEDENEDPNLASDEQELETAFKSICDDAGLVSRTTLKHWDEMKSLFDDGMLGEDEFDAIWAQTAKSPGSPDQIDVDGFLSFNVALDDLFVFEDDDEEEVAEEEGSSADDLSPTTKPRPEMVIGDDLPPGVIFAEIADDDFLVGLDELKRWGELQGMLADEELLPIELQNMFEEVPKAPGTKDKLNEDGFLALYDAIDALFEDVEEESEAQSDAADAAVPQSSIKEDLFSLLSELDRDEERLPCGLECTEREQERVLAIVAELEEHPSNLVVSLNANIPPEELTGNWDLVYSSSSTMKFNQGLSGLGGSFPNGKFGGLRQTLQSSKYMSDIEYTERINVLGGNSFDVTVTGDWKLRGSVNLFSGEPTVQMSVEPDRVTYGPTSTRADHWKSLGPMNLLDITYVDDDLRIMRGTTTTDTIFIFKRSRD